MSVYYKLTVWTPFEGTKKEYYFEVNQPMTEKLKEEILEEYVQIHADSYEYLVTGLNGNSGSEEEINNYYADCGGEWEEITEEEYENG
jgi:hypothetical protein